MTDIERFTSANSILLKVSTITGWITPEDDASLNALTEQVYKKMSESWSSINENEFEYALRNKPSEVKDYGKEINLSLLDEVVAPYLISRRELSRMEESIALRNIETISDKKDLTDEEWKDWLESVARYKVEIIPIEVYEYLEKKELLVLSNDQKHGYMDKAIARYFATLETGKPEYKQFKSMMDTGAFPHGETFDKLKTLAKKIAVKEYLNGGTTD